MNSFKKDIPYMMLFCLFFFSLLWVITGCTTQYDRVIRKDLQKLEIEIEDLQIEMSLLTNRIDELNRCQYKEVEDVELEGC